MWVVPGRMDPSGTIEINYGIGRCQTSHGYKIHSRSGKLQKGELVVNGTHHDCTREHMGCLGMGGSGCSHRHWLLQVKI